MAMGQKGLTVLAGELGEVVAKLETGEVTSVSVMDTAATGIAYYLPTNRQVIVLNPQLNKVTQLTLPEVIVGKPVISLMKNEVYYSTGGEIRALNMSTGISRLLRQQALTKQTLLGGYFEGTVLLCQLTDEAGIANMEYISSETGQTLRGSQGISNLQTDGAEFFTYWQDGTLHQTVFGTRGGEAQRFLAPTLPEDKIGGRVAFPAAKGVVDYVETENGLELCYYDLRSGKHTAQVIIPGMKAPTKLYCDGTYIWILTADKNNALYRWDLGKSTVTDENTYVTALYTSQNPDVQGLDQIRVKANEYQNQYGVKLHFWQDGVAHTGGHTLVAEHHTQVIEDALEKLITVLSQFPDRFLLKTVEKGWIRIALVQSIDGDKDWVQFWEEGDCWIVISSKADVVQAALQGIAYGVDSHVLGNSREFDDWAKVNPEGVTYAYNGVPEEKPELLEGDGRVFADMLSMTYPHEDRCRIFYNAMLPDNAAMFTSPVMKEKLLRVCMGIREGYNLQKRTETFAWEQYLETSLAYVEK